MPEHKDLTGDNLHEPKAHTHAQYVSGVQYVDVQLTDAQIKALPTTPVELVPAPGDGLALVAWHLFVLSDTTAAAYTNVELQAYAYLTGGGVNRSVALTVYSALHAAAVSMEAWGQTLPLRINTDILGGHDESGALVDRLLNLSLQGNNWSPDQPLSLGVFNTPDDNTDSGNFTGGEPANTLSIRLWYSVVPAAPFGGV